MSCHVSRERCQPLHHIMHVEARAGTPQTPHAQPRTPRQMS
jgi:hypothetical protein